MVEDFSLKRSITMFRTSVSGCSWIRAS